MATHFGPRPHSANTNSRSSRWWRCLNPFSQACGNRSFVCRFDFFWIRDQSIGFLRFKPFVVRLSQNLGGDNKTCIGHLVIVVGRGKAGQRMDEFVVLQIFRFVDHDVTARLGRSSPGCGNSWTGLQGEPTIANHSHKYLLSPPPCLNCSTWQKGRFENERDEGPARS